MLPFGMGAVMIVGGLSILAVSATCALLVIVTLAKVLQTNPARLFQISTPGAVLLLFAFYALFSLLVPLQIFEGTFLVFPLSRGDGGYRVSEDFTSTVSYLSFGSSNIAQLVYIALSVAIFCTVRYITTEKSVQNIHHSIVMAAAINILLGLINFIGLDTILVPVKTATYALLDDHYMMGYRRVIGGFSEASAYSGFSVTIAAYLLVYGVTEKSIVEIVFGLVQSILVFLTFSTTGYLGLVALAIFGIGYFVWNSVQAGHSKAESIALNIFVLFSIATFITVLVVPSLNSLLIDTIDSLFLSKADSQSGLERKAWADYSIAAFQQSYWLGAGVGSIRSNGLFHSIIGSMGIPGILIYLWFLKSIFDDFRFYLKTKTHDTYTGIVFAVSAALIVQLAMRGVSQTTPDPGVMFMILAGILSGLSRKLPVKNRETPASSSMCAADNRYSRCALE